MYCLYRVVIHIYLLGGHLNWGSIGLHKFYNERWTCYPRITSFVSTVASPMGNQGLPIISPRVDFIHG
jgi:TM2 domain-containing membrane protein YozV